MLDCGTLLYSGWVVEARLHFGYELKQYVGISVFVKQFSPSCLLARTSSLLLCVGIGSYLAYRLCLKIFGCNNLTSLLSRLKSECFGTECADKLVETLEPCCVKGDDDDDNWKSSKSVDSVVSNENTESTRLTDISGNEIGSTNFAQKSFLFYRRRSEQSTENEQNVQVLLRLNNENNNKAESARLDNDGLGEPRRTMALSDEDGDCCCRASTSSGSMHSPPPIKRNANSANKKSQSSLSRPISVPFRDSSASRCSSQAFAWDPVFTPCSMDATEFQALDAILTASNLNDLYSPSSLIERFLASLDTEAALQEDTFDRRNNMVSPGPSEVSEFSLADDRDLGAKTVTNMERLQGDLTDLKCDVKMFYDDFGKYFDERRQWIVGTEYSREMYKSVVVVPPSTSSESTERSIISSSRSCPVGGIRTRDVRRRRRKRWLSSGDNNTNVKNSSKRKSPEKCKKPKLSSSEYTCFGTEGSSFYDSYHTQISADLHASQTDEESCSDGKHCWNSDDEALSSSLRKAAMTSSSFVDSCISIDFRSNSSGSCENLAFNIACGVLPRFVPSLGVTPEDACDTENTSTAGSVRPSSLEWDEMDNNDNNNNFSSEQYNFVCNKNFSDSSPDSNAVDLMRYVRARYPGNEKSLKTVRHLAKRRGCRYVQMLEKGYDSLIRSCLQGAKTNQLPIFKCATYQAVKEAVDVCLKRCSYVTQYFATSASDDPINGNEQIVASLHHLWQFHSFILSSVAAANESYSLFSNLSDSAASKLVQGVKVLMMLRVVEVYEQISFTRKPPQAFYNELLRNRTLKSLAKQLSSCGTSRNLDETEIALLCDTLGVRLEIYNFDFGRNCSSPSPISTYPPGVEKSTLSTTESNRTMVGYFGSQNFMPLL